MPLEDHASLGVAYIAEATFRAAAAAYGCTAGVAALSTNNLKEILALASRSVDAYCAGQGFDPDAEIVENHDFDLNSRQIRPNQPPVVDLISFKIRTGPQSVTSFTLTPTAQDAGGNVVSWGAIFYNRQENYLELSSLSVAGNQVSTLISLGLMKAQAEISYKNGTSVPPEVVAATGYQAAHLINMSRLDNQITPGVLSMATPELSITRETGQRTGRTADALHPMVALLLRKPTFISVA